MATQAEGGHVFNMLGAGRRRPDAEIRRLRPHESGHGAAHHNAGGEVKDTGNATFGVHATLPDDMVFGELRAAAAWSGVINAFGSQGRFFVNILAEPPEVPAAFLVEKVRAFVEEVGAEESAPSGSENRARRAARTEARGSGGRRDGRGAHAAGGAEKILRRVVLGEGKDRYYPEKE